MRVFTVRGFFKRIASVAAFLVEVLVYAGFVAGYFLLVLRFLNRPLEQVFDDNKILYAILALMLISVQGFTLERLTSGLLWVIRRIQAFISALLRLFHPYETIIKPSSMPGLLVYRFAGPLFFFNAPHFARRVHELIDTADPPIAFFLIDAEAMVEIDEAGVEVLEHLHGTLKEKNVTLGLCEAKGHFQEALSEMPHLADVVYLSMSAVLRKLNVEQLKKDMKSGVPDIHAGQ